MFVKIRGLMEKKHIQEMARTVVVFRVFRAVLAPPLDISTMLAIAALGGVLRRAVSRMLGFGICTEAFPIGTLSITRVTVFQFVASEIKSSTTCAEPAEALGSLRFPKRSRVKCVGFFFNL